MTCRGRHALCALATTLTVCGSAAAASAKAPSWAAAFVAASPACPSPRGGKAKAQWCISLEVGIASEGGRPVVDAGWLAAQVVEANTHFARAGVSFRVARVFDVGSGFVTVTTRADRDRLGRHARIGRKGKRAGVPVFVVGSLHDVDVPGVIRGVHWRDRADRARRWVIVSRIAPLLVLGHELGHYFGLRHAREAASIMNKRPRVDPPPSEWSFVPREVRRIRRRVRSERRRRALQMERVGKK